VTIYFQMILDLM